MKQSRLEALSDGIFAIVMTILVFEIKVPGILAAVHYSNLDIWLELKRTLPSFLSYVLSFAMLFNYWRAHHFFASVYAKNVDLTLTNINAVFFLFVGLVPFSSSLLGHNSNFELPIIIFAVNTIIIGSCLYAMRNYVLKSPHIENTEVSKEEILRGTIRIMVPIISAFIAIPLSFYNKELALAILTLAILFNFSHTSSQFFTKVVKLARAA